jgi:hypothetical protein
VLEGMTATQFSEWVAYCEHEKARAEEQRGNKPCKAKGKDKAKMFKAWFAPRIKKAEK